MSPIDDRNDGTVPVAAVVPRPLVQSRELDDRRLELRPPRFRGFWLGWLQRYLPEDRAHVRVGLDPLGSSVWRNLDGSRDIGAVTAALVADGQLDEGTASLERVWLFLRGMAAEGWVDLMLPGETTTGGS